MKKIIHAENCTLKEILTNINIGLYDISDYGKIIIISKLKPNNKIICVEADITDDISVFVGNNYNNDKSITFDPSILDFVVVNDKIDESGKLVITCLSLLDLLLSSNLIDTKENWSLDSEEFICIEEIDENELKTLENELKTSDMNIMG